MKLKWEKCKFKVEDVGYVGHLLTQDGLKPDPEKVIAIVEISMPNDVKSLQRFIGMVRYLSKSVPRLSEQAQRCKTFFMKTWNSVQQEAFDNLKYAIVSAPTQYYDVQKPVTLSCDASFGGLVAACLQNGRPVAYASRSLTKTEQCYAQIEKELITVLFACKKFHDYTIGKHITVDTDRKPLETILKKPLLSAPMRL